MRAEDAKRKVCPFLGPGESTDHPPRYDSSRGAKHTTFTPGKCRAGECMLWVAISHEDKTGYCALVSLADIHTALEQMT